MLAKQMITSTVDVLIDVVIAGKIKGYLNYIRIEFIRKKSDK